MWGHPSEDFSVSNIRYFSRHKGEVNCCAFSRDCQILLTCCDDGRLYLWKANNAQHLATVRGHSGPVKSCVFSWDGQLFASTSNDRSVRIWSRSSTECTHILTTSILISPVEDCHHALCPVMFVWCLMSQSSEMLEDLRGHTAAVQCVVPRSSWDRTVRVCKLHEEKEPVTLQGHQADVACVCFSVSGTLVKMSFDV
uniref:Uncharacterized protein n=1 Tax=Sinocyclocheilus anshuiensis TaxID=1608454 RepID=A0A671QLD2_9TELE